MALGGGENGHLSIGMKLGLYGALYETLCEHPEDLGSSPNTPEKNKAAERQQFQGKHKETKKISEQHILLADALKGKIIDATKEPYLCKNSQDNLSLT